MKQFFVLVLLSLLSYGAQAQFKAGERVLSGAFTYGESNARSTYLIPGSSIGPVPGYPITFISDKIKTLKFSPRVGFFVSDNFELGGMASYAFAESYGINFDGNAVESKSETLVVGPYVRKYIRLNDWASFYAQGNLTYGRARSAFGNPGVKLQDSDGRIRLLEFGVNPGLALRFGKVGVELQASLFNLSRAVSGNKDNFSETKSEPLVEWEFGPNLSNTSLGFSFYF